MANPLTSSLASLFRSKADVTSLKRLEREGIRTVNVLDLGQLEEIVGEAIERALLDAAQDGASPMAAAQGAQVEFLKMLGGGERLGRKRGELARQQATLRQNLSELEVALGQSQAELEARSAERERGSMQELRRHLDQSLREAFERAGARVTSIAPEASEALASMQEPLRAAMLSLLAAALQKARPTGEPTTEETEVETLQRRITKLAAQLEETQQLLVRTQQAKASELDGIASEFRVVQGLKDSDARVEQRRALMREIFEHNLEMRRSLAAATYDASPPDPSSPKKETSPP